jgi:hypothetical protein
MDRIGEATRFGGSIPVLQILIKDVTMAETIRRPSSSFLRAFSLSLTLLTIGIDHPALAEEAVAEVPAALPERATRVGGDFYRNFGSDKAETRQGFGLGFSILFPFHDTGVDLGARYGWIDQVPNAFTFLTFVFDYQFWRSVLPGAYIGGEIGITKPDATSFLSVVDDYIFTGKIGYEYALPQTRWSAALEFRRSFLNTDPIKPDSESRLYSNALLLAARYSL